MRILVTGVSGTGKSTVCRELAARGIATVGIDETPGLSYWINSVTKERITKKADFTEDFLATHEWVCDLEVLKEKVSGTDETMVICGNVENILECMNFCDTTLLLVCSPETFLARIDAREDNEYGKSEAAKQALLGYYQETHDMCTAAGAAVIDAEQPVDAVVTEVLEHIK